LFFIRVQKSVAFLKYWLPPLLWMAVIFFASGDSKSAEHSSRYFEPLLRWLFPQMSQEYVETIHHLFRKCGHLAEYSILALLVWRALNQSKNRLSPWSVPFMRPCSAAISRP